MKAAKLILEQNCPLVFLDRMLPTVKADAVLVDDFAGAYSATRHLIEQGMRYIVHLAPRAESYVAQERCRGYLTALADSNVEFQNEWIIKIGGELQHGRDAVSLLFNSGIKPDAIFCFNDPLAIGVSMELLRRGVKIPDEIAVVGFSATVETEITQIPITTVFQDAIGLGQQAAELLLARMINLNLKIPPRKKILKTNLIVRQSSSKT
jgi:LacI family transcriptional regulator